MQYSRLGNSGLKVSSLCLGTMTFGDGADMDMCKKLYALSRDKGINFFDCANVYAKGESERILGKLVHEHRDQVVLATKAFFPTGEAINDKGLSRLHLTRELEKSLKRLNTHYIDVFYLHSFDKETPLEESLSTLNDFLRQGKVLYIGLSNFSAWQVMKARALTTQFNYDPITCIQPMYNLLKRQCESEILPMAHGERLGVVPYSPLAGGMLTGKYLKTKPSEGRFERSGKMGDMYQKRYLNEVNELAVKKFLKFARENNFDPVSLAIAWVNGHDSITCPIIGARNEKQLKPALESLAIDMTSDLRSEISGFSLAPAIATDRTEEM